MRVSGGKTFLAAMENRPGMGIHNMKVISFKDLNMV